MCIIGSLSDRSSHAAKFFLSTVLLYKMPHQSYNQLLDFMGTCWCTQRCLKNFEMNSSALNCIFVLDLPESCRGPLCSLELRKVAVSLSNMARWDNTTKRKYTAFKEKKKGKKENKLLDFPLFLSECLVFDDNCKRLA